MKCFFCPRSVEDGHSLFRINPKGQKGIWACAEHVSQTDTHVDPEVRHLVGILENGR